MARTRSMSRNHNHDDGASSSSREKRPKSCARWSDLDHDVLYIVMMKLGVVDFLSFRGVCKSWRSLTCENENKFMESRPPMHMIISHGTNEKTCRLEDFEGRKFKTDLPNFVGGACVGVTCGYLIFFSEETRDFWLVNPITRKELHFYDLPMNYCPLTLGSRAILVFSPSTSGLVFVVLYSDEIWFSVVGKGTWNSVPHNFTNVDLCVFKGKIYVVIYGSDTRYQLCELRLSPQPKLTLLKIKMPGFLLPNGFVSSRENLFAICWHFDGPISLHELDVGEMKWVVPSDKTLGKYAFFSGKWDREVAVKRESWADPRSRSHARFASSSHNGIITFFTEKMCYFPHECMNVDRIDQ